MGEKGPQSEGETTPNESHAKFDGTVEVMGNEDEAEQVPPDVEELMPEEAEPMRNPPDPIKPDAATIELHRKTHIPFRIWCLFCLLGRGLGEQRGRHIGRAHAIARVGIDYWFITTGSLWRRDELKELKYEMNGEGEAKLTADRNAGKVVKCIIIRCYKTGCIFAHVVPCKGLDEDNYVLNLVVSAVAWLGHAKLILKSDGEAAITKLVRRSLEEIKCNVEGIDTATSEESHPYDSQANGGTEVGIRNVRGLFRSLKLGLEERIGNQLPPSHPLTPWILEHTALLLNACTRGTDGKTSWERARGRPFGLRSHEFGESVVWKQPAKGPQHDPEGNMGPRQHVGTFFGYNKVSNSYRIMTENGDMVKARSLTARPIEDRWHPEVLKATTVTPWRLRKKEDAAKSQLGPPVERQEPPARAPTTTARRLKITKRMLKDPRIGTSEGCQQCRHFRSFGETKDGLAHSEPCRKRILEAVAQTDDGMARLVKHEERIDRAISERIHDAQEQAGPVAAGSRGVAARASTDPDPAADAQHEDFPRDGAETPRALDEPNEPASDSGGPSAEGAADDDMTDDGGAGSPDDNRDTEMTVGCVSLEEAHVQLLSCLGVQGGAYRRENRRAYNRIVSEIYSPPRVTRMVSCMPSLKLLPGYALDITVDDPDDGQPWDFDDKTKREKARRLIREQKPLFLIGSPMCTAWCAWQRLNEVKGDPEKIRRAKIRARVHLDFVMELYAEQVEGGRYFLHEHPKSATSWEEASVNKVMQIDGVKLVHADQCQYGSEVTFGKYRGRPVKKPTGFMSNAPALLESLERKCGGHGGECSRREGGKHAICQGKIAKEAAKYSRGLCRAIVKGMHNQMRSVGIVRDHEIGLHAVTDEPAVETLIKDQDPRYSGKFKDDITGQVLRDDLVREARKKELEYFKTKGVWAKRPRREARQVTGRGPISVRWVDVNKGDDLCPKYRSRLVARQLKAHDRSNASYFAPTPPLEALRTVLSLAATKLKHWQPDYRPDSDSRMQLSFLDISRAYFNAKTDSASPTYVSLPPEDDDCEEKCALLLRHMYGTRAAADGWQEEYSSFLVSVMGFKQGTASPCLFRHPNRQIALSVHGDDFTAAGAKPDLDWYESKMKEHYELTTQPRMGPGAEDAKEAVVLNRIIRWTDKGVEMEADPRQAEKLISECGMEGVNTVATPGIRVSFAEAENDHPLPDHLHTAFRGAAARANYLAADRLDCQFAAKEVCRWMAKPSSSSWQALKRLCRYLVGLPRLVHIYRWQEVDTVDVYTDTDWNGCPRTRKSTSGGCVVLGSHTIKTWSSTQASVSLSSGEAEFNGVVRGSGVGLGYCSLLRDLGHELPLRVWTDSSAALGICSRQGLGKLRHLDTHTLWVQQAVRAGQVDLRKIDGEVNPADVFTKHSLTRERLMSLVRLFDAEYRGGRAPNAAQTRKAPIGRKTIAEADIEKEAINEIHDDGQRDPVMPHRIYSKDQLNELYPAFTVPDAPDADDPLAGEQDHLLDHGLKRAQEIMKEAEDSGRKRYAEMIRQR